MENRPPRVYEDILRRVRGEFLEMPGLRLTRSQACRLWALDDGLCAQVLAELVKIGFLLETRMGAYMRVETGEPIKAPPPARASRGKTSAA